MKQFTKEIRLSTQKKRELINITEAVEKIVSQSGIKEGFCFISALHATGAIILNEDEERLKTDFLNFIEKILPSDDLYQHNIHDDNAPAHLAASLFGQNQALVIKDNRIQRGTWQEIFFLELDGPREERFILVQLIGQ